jgi:hypothetical protein
MAEPTCREPVKTPAAPAAMIAEASHQGRHQLSLLAEPAAST